MAAVERRMPMTSAKAGSAASCDAHAERPGGKKSPQWLAFRGFICRVSHYARSGAFVSSSLMGSFAKGGFCGKFAEILWEVRGNFQAPKKNPKAKKSHEQRQRII